ncbi:MAG: SCO family protein, partial [Sedimenticola sp.]|nr:SCO family protein [Sedimenticola sp.]
TDELNKLTKQFGILYARVNPEGSELDYLMDHSSAIILINPDGGFQAVFSAPHDVKQMAEDLIKITGR